jgi:sulfur carrier protein
MLTIELNGEARTIPEQHTLQELVASLELPPQALAVAVNRSVVPRQQWQGLLLKAQDKIDIVRAIGGG